MKSNVPTWIAVAVAISLLYFGSWPPVKAFHDAKYSTRLFPPVLRTFYAPAAWLCKQPRLKQPMRDYWIWCYEWFGGKL